MVPDSVDGRKLFGSTISPAVRAIWQEQDCTLRALLHRNQFPTVGMTMQNRYVGDVGDFAKYALLRRLVGRPTEEALRLGVVWCLFPDESHNNDGRHVSYLRAAGFTSLDDDLRVRLERIVGSRRSVSAIQE